MFTPIFSHQTAVFAPPAREITLLEVAEIVRGETLREKILEIRAAQNIDFRKRLKNNLPCITPAGVFLNRRRKQNLIQSANCVQVDYDHSGDDSPAIIAWLVRQPFTALVYRSPSGDGVKALLRIPETVGWQDYERLTAAVWLVLQRDAPFAKYLDKDTMRSSQPMSLSWDDAAYFSADCSEMVVDLVAPEKAARAVDCSGEALAVDAAALLAQCAEIGNAVDSRNSLYLQALCDVGVMRGRGLIDSDTAESAAWALAARRSRSPIADLNFYAGAADRYGLSRLFVDTPSFAPATVKTVVRTRDALLDVAAKADGDDWLARAGVFSPPPDNVFSLVKPARQTTMRFGGREGVIRLTASVVVSLKWATLSPSQVDAIRGAVFAFSVGRDEVAVGGGAGSGKTTIIPYLCAAMGLADDDVLVVSISGMAARQARMASGCLCSTIHRLLWFDQFFAPPFLVGGVEVDTVATLKAALDGMVSGFEFGYKSPDCDEDEWMKFDVSPDSAWSFLGIDESEMPLAGESAARAVMSQRRDKEKIFSEWKPKVVVIDEAGQVDAESLAEVKGLARAVGAKIILIGDKNQTMSRTSDFHPNFYLTGNYRQSPVMQTLVRSFTENTDNWRKMVYCESETKQSRCGSVEFHAYETDEVALMAATEMIQRAAAERLPVITRNKRIMSHLNSSVRKLDFGYPYTTVCNHYISAKDADARRMEAPILVRNETLYFEDETIINGSRYARMTAQDGSTIFIAFRHVKDLLRVNVATNVHKIQGSQFEGGILCLFGAAAGAAANSDYVSLTRLKKKVILITAAESEAHSSIRNKLKKSIKV